MSRGVAELATWRSAGGDWSCWSVVVAIEETEGDEDATEGKIGLDSGFLSGGEVFHFGCGRGKRKQKNSKGEGLCLGEQLREGKTKKIGFGSVWVILALISKRGESREDGDPAAG